MMFYNHYYGQTVHENIFHDWQRRSEQAVGRVIEDLNLVHGLSEIKIPTENTVPDLNIKVPANKAYINSETDVYETEVTPTAINYLARTSWTEQTIDCSVDYLSASTIPTTDKKYLLVTVKFDRTKTKDRLTYDSQTIKYLWDEGFEFRVRQSSESASPTKVSIPSDEVYICDILINASVTQIDNPADINNPGDNEIDYTRAQYVLPIKDFIKTTFDGKVGIGVDTPLKQLDVNETILVRPGTASLLTENIGSYSMLGYDQAGDRAYLGSYNRTADTNTNRPFAFDASNYVFYYNNGVSVLEITSTGQLKFPADMQLDKIVLYGDGTSASYRIGTESGGGIVYNVDAGDSGHFHDFRFANNTIMRIRGDGFIGIGTVNPWTTLSMGGGFGGRAWESGSPYSSFSLRMQRSRGTEASPTSVLSGDILGVLQVGGYDGNNNWTSEYDGGAGIRFYASENWTSVSNHGSHISFHVTGANNQNSYEATKLTHDGRLLIGMNGYIGAVDPAGVIGTHMGDNLTGVGFGQGGFNAIFTSSVGNTDNLLLWNRRSNVVTGDWSDYTQRIQRKVDADFQGFIEFGKLNALYNGIDFGYGGTYHFRISDSGKLSTGGYATPDCDVGGITLFTVTGAQTKALTVKQSGLSHGVTGFEETNTAYSIGPQGSGATPWGGFTLNAVTISSVAMFLRGIATTEVTTDTVSSQAAIMVQAYKKSGTGAGAFGATANIFAITDYTNTRLILKASGQMHITNTTLVALDSYNDIKLIDEARNLIHNKNKVYISKENAKVLKDKGIFNDDFSFINLQALNALQLDAQIQTFNMIKGLAEKLGIKEKELLKLAKKYN